MLAQTWQANGGSPHPEAAGFSGNFRAPLKKSARARILVVDDEALIRWSVAETLGENDYEIEEAADGASAIGAVSPNGAAIDLVLLDLRLPDCDDLHVLSAIRRMSPDMPVILMTAFGSRELIQEAQRLGVFAIVDKPFELETLAPLVERALAARLH